MGALIVKAYRFGQTIVDAVRARLDETPQDERVSVNGRSLPFDAASKEIVTVLVRLEG